jgi:hypothetical protein
MSTNTSFAGLVTKLRGMLLAALALIIMFAASPSAQVQAAGSSLDYSGNTVRWDSNTIMPRAK